MGAEHSQVRVFAMLLLCTSFVGCASDALPPSAEKPGAVEKPHPRTRELDLIVPPSSSDPAKLDDAALAGAIQAGNAQVNALLAKSLDYAAAYEGSDLSRDSAYRKMLLDMRTVETELGKLEDEAARRKKDAKR